MEVQAVRALERPLVKGRAGEVTTICFHPERHSLYLAVSNTIFAYDLHSEAITGQRTVASRVTRLAVTDDYITVGCEDGTIFIFEGEYNVNSANGPFSLITEIKPPKSSEVQSIRLLAIAPFCPFLFYSRYGSKEVSIWDLDTKGKIKFPLEMKKQTTAIAFDQYQPNVAIAAADGSVRIWDYKRKTSLCQSDDFNNLAASKSIPQSKISSILFRKDGNVTYFLAVGRSGLIVVWELTRENKLKLLGGRRINTKAGDVVSAYFHSTLPIFNTINSDGTFVSWKLAPNSKTSWVQPSGYVFPFNAVKAESDNRRWRLNGYSDKVEPPNLRARFIAVHPSHQYVAFVYDDVFKYSYIEKGLKLPQTLVYSLLPPENMGLLLPKVDRLDLPASFFTESKFAFDYPRDTFLYLDTSKIQSHSFSDTKNLLEEDLPTIDEDTQSTVHPYRLVHSPLQKQNLVFFEFYYVIDKVGQRRSSPQAGEEKTIEKKAKKKSKQKFSDLQLTTSPANTTAIRKTRYKFYLTSDAGSKSGEKKLQRGRDGVFLGTNHMEYMYISERGRKAFVASTSTSMEKKSKTKLSSTVTRVFRTPLGNERTVMYFDSAKQRLVFSANCSAAEVAVEGASMFSLSTNPGHSLQLGDKETPMDLLWKPQPTSAKTQIGAVLTRKSIRIFSVDMQGIITPLVHHKRPIGAVPFYFYSCYWVGYSLLYTTPTQLCFVTLNGTAQPVATLPNQGAVIATVLNDRVLYATHWRDRTQIQHQPIGLLEVVLAGQLDVPSQFLPPAEQLHPLIGVIASRFDGYRISDNLIEKLEESGYPDLALALAEKSPRFTPLWKADLAMKAFLFDKAYYLLFMLHKSSPDYPSLRASSELHEKFSELARVSQDFGQYETAQKCYELLGNNYALFYLYGLNRDIKALNALKEKYNKEQQDSKTFLKPLLSSNDVAGGGVPSSQQEDQRQRTQVETAFLLPELCQRQISTLSKTGQEGSVTNWPLESIYSKSKWNVTKGQNPIMRFRPGEEVPWPIEPIRVEGVEDWLPKKLDWNASFIPSSRRVGYVPNRKSPEHTFTVPSEAKPAQEQQQPSTTEEGKKVTSTVLADHITLRLKSDTHSASISLRRTTSEENLAAEGEGKSEAGGDDKLKVPHDELEPDTEEGSVLDEPSDSESTFSENSTSYKTSIDVNSSTLSSPHGTEEIVDDDSTTRDQDIETIAMPTDDTDDATEFPDEEPGSNAGSSDSDSDGGSDEDEGGGGSDASSVDEDTVIQEGSDEDDDEVSQSVTEVGEEESSDDEGRGGDEEETDEASSNASTATDIKSNTSTASALGGGVGASVSSVMGGVHHVRHSVGDEDLNFTPSKSSRFFNCAGNPIALSFNPLIPPKAKKSASECIVSMMRNIEKGLLSDALEDSETAVRLLNHGKEVEKVRRQVKFVVNYRLALTALILINQLKKQKLHQQQQQQQNSETTTTTTTTPATTTPSTPTVSTPTKSLTTASHLSPFPSRLSSSLEIRITSGGGAGAGVSGSNDVVGVELLTKLLTEIPLEFSHRVAVIRMAIEANMEMENYGFTSQVIKRLLANPIAPFSSSGFDNFLQNKLEVCLEGAKVSPSSATSSSSGVVPHYVCPCCGWVAPKDELVGDSCDRCKSRIRYSYKTFQYITRRKYFSCAFCDAVYADDIRKCRYCGVSNMQKQRALKAPSLK